LLAQKLLTMTTRTIPVERLTVLSSRPFGQVVAAIDAAIGHPDIGELSRKMAEAQTLDELNAIVQPGLGPTGLMLFARFDLGAVVRREPGHKDSQIVRFVVGNPLIMKEMVKHVPDAGSYAPVTILVDQRGDRVHLSYDRMASLLAPYSNPDALAVARNLDLKVEQLLMSAA
jgi:uncharacterized protein (DUF302 family)